MVFDPLYASRRYVDPMFRPFDPARNPSVDAAMVGRQLVQSTDGLPPEAAGSPEMPYPSPYEPTQGDRLTGAVASFGANTDPNSVYAPEQFFGSAARGFAGVKTYLNNLRATHAEGQRQARKDDLEKRNIESQIRERDRVRTGQVNAPRVGESKWISDPDDPAQELSMTKNPSTGEWTFDTFPDGRQMVRPKTVRDESKANNTRFDNVAGLRREFNTLIVPHQTVARAAQSIETAANDPSAAGDLNLIFSYMKILDPNSAVREAEFANAQNAAGVPEQIRAQWNKVKNGERLTPTTRADFLRQARGLVESQRSQVRQYIDRYTGLARQNGFNPSEVVSDPYDFGAPPVRRPPPAP